MGEIQLVRALALIGIVAPVAHNYDGAAVFGHAGDVGAGALGREGLRSLKEMGHGVGRHQTVFQDNVADTQR